MEDHKNYSLTRYFHLIQKSNRTPSLVKGQLLLCPNIILKIHKDQTNKIQQNIYLFFFLSLTKKRPGCTGGMVRCHQRVSSFLQARFEEGTRACLFLSLGTRWGPRSSVLTNAGVPIPGSRANQTLGKVQQGFT